MGYKLGSALSSTTTMHRARKGKLTNTEIPENGEIRQPTGKYNSPIESKGKIYRMEGKGKGKNLPIRRIPENGEIRQPTENGVSIRVTRVTKVSKIQRQN